MAQENGNVHDWLQQVVIRTQVRTLYLTDKNADEIGAMIETLISYLCDECTTIEELPIAFSAFATYSDLFESPDFSTNETGKVHMLSVHAAKGLEYDLVVLPALEDGLFPSKLDQKSPEKVLEAGRLFYVAVTRPRQALILSHAQQRADQAQHPSEFVSAARAMILAQDRWKVYYEALAQPVSIAVARRVLVDSTDKHFSGREWQLLERVASDYPGSLAITVLYCDEHYEPCEIDTAYTLAANDESLGALQAMLHRRCVPVS